MVGFFRPELRCTRRAGDVTTAGRALPGPSMPSSRLYPSPPGPADACFQSVLVHPEVRRRLSVV